MDYKQSTLSLRVENVKKELEAMAYKSLARPLRRQVYFNLVNLLDELETEIIDQEVAKG